MEWFFSLSSCILVFRLVRLIWTIYQQTCLPACLPLLLYIRLMSWLLPRIFVPCRGRNKLKRNTTTNKKEETVWQPPPDSPNPARGIKRNPLVWDHSISTGEQAHESTRRRTQQERMNETNVWYETNLATTTRQQME